MKMKRVFLILITLSLLCATQAADFCNGNLVLEVLVTQGKQLTISSDKPIKIAEYNSKRVKEYSQSINLKLTLEKEDCSWGIIDKAELLQSPPAESVFNPLILLENNIREVFFWKEGKLQLQYEKLFFKDKTFATKESAEAYAKAIGLTAKQVAILPSPTSRLIVQNGALTDSFNLPITLTTQSNLYLNKDVTDFTGNFILKQIKNNLVLTQLLTLEEYVIGVIPNEIGNDAPPEALKAQAVASRSHALNLLLTQKHQGDGFDLCNSVHCQVFKGNYLRNKAIEEAVQSTRNMILFYDSKAIDATYHSNCGGKTDSSKAIWGGKDVPYLQGVICVAQSESLDLSKETDAIKWIETKPSTTNGSSWEKRSAAWERKIPKSNLEANLGISNLHTAEILQRSQSGRILQISLKGKTNKIIKGEYNIRQLFGGLPSSCFYIVDNHKYDAFVYTLSDTITIKGKGAGHGVGMCQVGTLEKARTGWTWDQILMFYYPGTKIINDWLPANQEKTKVSCKDKL